MYFCTVKTTEEKIEHLIPFATDERLTRFNEILAHRMRHLTVVVEDVYQAHNTSAVLRSCDCFGVQDVHIIENKNEFSVNPDIALGSSKWLNVNRYNEQKNNTVECLRSLKKRGYKIAATTPHTDDVMLSDLDLSQPTALVFGTEKEGISDLVRQEADSFVRIPMYGFTESYNISVSAALCLYECTERIRKEGLNWELSESEKNEILLSWLKNSIKSSSNILEKLEKS
jgi:tRNA (guanosine-2'-O-)-methyltransferase